MATWLGLLVILVALVILIRRPTAVTVATVRSGNMAAEVEGTGTVTADNLATVAPRITGRVQQVFADQGDVVHKGQLLARLDQGVQRAELKAAQAKLAAATAIANERQREWRREQTMIASGAVGTEEAQQYQERDAVAQSDMRAAAARLELAKYRLSLTEIRSLSTGVVTQRWVVPGASVVPGQAMFTVADTNLVYVNANVDQNVGGELRKGQSATVLLRGLAGQPLQGHVLRIRPRANAVTEETVAEVSFPWPPSQPFQLGQWANVFVRVRKATHVLLIPRAALMAMGETDTVWVVNAGDRVHPISIRVTASSPRLSSVAVTGPLQAGERLVLMPRGLHPGQKVRPSFAAPKPMMGAM